MSKKKKKKNNNAKNNNKSKKNQEEVSVDDLTNSLLEEDLINRNTVPEDDASTNARILAIEKILLRLSGEFVALNLAKSSMEALNIDESEKIFFDRKVKPLLDSVYFLGLTSNSIAATGQAYNANPNGRRRDVKQALDLSSNINREIECIFKTLQKRMKAYRCGIEKQLDCCNENCDNCGVNIDETE